VLALETAAGRDWKGLSFTGGAVHILHETGELHMVSKCHSELNRGKNGEFCKMESQIKSSLGMREAGSGDAEP